MVFAGVDAGYGFTKAIAKDANIIFPSVVGKARQRVLIAEKANILNELHVEVDKSEYFVGDLARRDSLDASVVLSVEKVATSRVLVLTALALLTNTSAEIRLATGLPIAHYLRQREILKESLSGHHTVKFLAGKRRGETIHLYLDVLIFPQGAGAILTTDLPSGRICCVDIGYKTTDYVMMEDLKYIDQASGSLPLGMSTAYKHITNRLNGEGKEVLLTDLHDYQEDCEEFQALANRLKILLEPTLTQDTEVILAGGGALALEKYLPWTIISDPQFSNARGFYDVAQNR